MVGVERGVGGRRRPPTRSPTAPTSAAAPTAPRSTSCSATTASAASPGNNGPGGGGGGPRGAPGGFGGGANGIDQFGGQPGIDAPVQQRHGRPGDVAGADRRRRAGRRAGPRRAAPPAAGRDRRPHHVGRLGGLDLRRVRLRRGHLPQLLRVRAGPGGRRARRHRRRARPAPSSGRCGRGRSRSSPWRRRGCNGSSSNGSTLTSGSVSRCRSASWSLAPSPPRTRVLPNWRSRAVPWLLGVGLGLALVPAAVWTWSGTQSPQNGTFPDARPVSAGGALGQGFPGGGRRWSRRVAGGVSDAELAWLQTQQTTERWLLAVGGSQQASGAIIQGYFAPADGWLQRRRPGHDRQAASPSWWPTVSCASSAPAAVASAAAVAARTGSRRRPRRCAGRSRPRNGVGRAPARCYDCQGQADALSAFAASNPAIDQPTDVVPADQLPRRPASPVASRRPAARARPLRPDLAVLMARRPSLRFGRPSTAPGPPASLGFARRQMRTGDARIGIRHYLRLDERARERARWCRSATSSGCWRWPSSRRS